ncbi:AfsR/SARP family transcriptional regulator [Streptomyces mayteni]
MPPAEVGFLLLGSLEVHVGGRAVALTGRQRQLLAVLLLEANRVVSVDRLADGLWGEAQPASPAARVLAALAPPPNRIRPARGVLRPERKRPEIGSGLPASWERVVHRSAAAPRRRQSRLLAAVGWAPGRTCDVLLPWPVFSQPSSRFSERCSASP